MDNDAPSRERFEAALALKTHDRPPVIEFFIDPVNMSCLVGRDVRTEGGPTPEEIRDIDCRLGFDLFPIAACPEFFALPQPSEEGRYKVGGLDTWEDLEAAEDPIAPEAIAPVAKRQIAFAAERGLGAYAFFVAPFTSLYCGMGIDRFWLRTIEDPGFIEAAFDKATDHATRVMEAVSGLDITMMVIADDVAFNNGLLLEKNQFAELWMPRMRRFLAPVANHVPIMLHTCGNWRDVLPLADELGVAAIEPIQPTCNDIYQIEKDWGDRFCILGNIDIAGVLAFGTPDDVRADVREHIDRLAGNGGYVVHSSHSIVDAIPHDNFLAMVDEARTYGRRAQPGGLPPAGVMNRRPNRAKARAQAL